MNAMNDWLNWMRSHQAAMWWIAAASVLMFAASLAVVSVVIVWIPADYFARSRRPKSVWTERPLVVRCVWFVVKNVLGVALLLAGLVMLITPGQGLLSIFAGIMLMDLPGKYRLERWLVRRPPVLRSINWLRRRKGAAPLVIDS